MIFIPGILIQIFNLAECWGQIASKKDKGKYHLGLKMYMMDHAYVHEMFTKQYNGVFHTY